MKSNYLKFNAFIILFTLKVVFCYDFCDDPSNNVMEMNQFLMQEWGTITNNSVRIDLTTWYTRTFDEGTIAIWNVTILRSRVMHGIRLNSVDNTVSSAEIIQGGIGFTIATFTVVGHGNNLIFIVDTFETPDIIFKEWGTINNASLVLFPHLVYIGCSENEQQINTTRIMHGIRIVSSLDSIASAEITEGGIGFMFARILIRPRVNLIKYSITMFENGPQASTTPATSTTGATTNIPETRTEVLGRIDNEAWLINEKRFENYPQKGLTAEGNGSFQVSETIFGIRLTSLNFTDGLWEITEGGLNQSSVTFNFRGSDVGRPYDFKIEIYGNNARALKLSTILVILLCVLNRFR